MNRQPMRHRQWFWVLMVLGMALRLWQLDRYPLPMNQDELSNAYDGWSLAETGQDRHGQAWPAVLRAMGRTDYRPALYAWLSAATQRLTGPGIWQARIVSALLGICSLWLLYDWVRKAWDESLALLVLALSAGSWWHIWYSRTAHEGAMLPAFFVVTALWGAGQALRSGRGYGWWLVGLSCGLSANAYQASKLTGLLFCLCIGGWLLWAGHRRWLAGLAVAALIGASPQIMVLLTQPEQFFARAQAVTGEYGGRLPLHVGWRVLLNLDPRHLFGIHPDNLSIARLNVAEAPFFYGGLLSSLWWRRSNERAHLALLLVAGVACLAPAVMSVANPHALRASGCCILAPVWIALGLREASQWLGAYFSAWHQSLCRVWWIVWLAGFLAVPWYYAQSPRFQEWDTQHLLFRTVRALPAHWSSPSQLVFVEHLSTDTYLYIAAFLPLRPADFQALPREVRRQGPYDDWVRMGPFRFLPPGRHPADEAAARAPGTCWIARRLVPPAVLLERLDFAGDTICIGVVR